MFTPAPQLSFATLTRILVACSMLLMCAYTQAQGTQSPTGAPIPRGAGSGPSNGGAGSTQRGGASQGNEVGKVVAAAAAITFGAFILDKILGKKEEPAKPAAPAPVTPPVPTQVAAPPAPVVWIGAPKSAAVNQPPVTQSKPPMYKPNERLIKLQAQLDEAQARINKLTTSNAETTNALASSNSKLADTEKKLAEQEAAAIIAKQSLKGAQARAAAAAEQRVIELRAQQATFEQRAWWLVALAATVLLGLCAALVRALWALKPKLITVSVSPGAWSLHAEQAHAEPKGCFKIHTEWQAVRALVQKYEPNSTAEPATLRTA